MRIGIDGRAIRPEPDGIGRYTQTLIRAAASAFPDAEIVVNGHTHDSWVLPRARARLSQRNKPYKDLLWFVRLPGYKDEYGDGAEGWAAEKWRDPRPRGAAWLRFYLDGNKIRDEITQAII